MTVPSELTALFRSELELCGVGKRVSVAILTGGHSRADYAEAFEIASMDLDARCFQLRIPLPLDADGATNRRRAVESLNKNPAAIAALSEADIVVDLLNMVWSPAQIAILSSGTRVLSCHEPPEVLTRLFPTAERTARVERDAKVLGAAKTLRVWNDAGSELTYELGSYPVLAQRGFTDEPGRWDHFASALVATCGRDDGVNGVLVLAPGDVILPLRRFVTEPVTLDIHAGRIQAISGGADAALVREYMDQFNDPDAFGISHVGWGLAETADWAALETLPLAGGIENRSYYGNVMFSTGPNTEFGGPNHTPCHLDIPMRNASLSLDGESVVSHGKVVADEGP